MTTATNMERAAQTLDDLATTERRHAERAPEGDRARHEAQARASAYAGAARVVRACMADADGAAALPAMDREGLVACIVEHCERHGAMAAPNLADAILARFAPPAPVVTVKDAEDAVWSAFNHAGVHASTDEENGTLADVAETAARQFMQLLVTPAASDSALLATPQPAPVVTPEMVEAGARAAWASVERAPYGPWEWQSGPTRDQMRTQARACLTAALGTPQPAQPAEWLDTPTPGPWWMLEQDSSPKLAEVYEHAGELRVCVLEAHDDESIDLPVSEYADARWQRLPEPQYGTPQPAQASEPIGTVSHWDRPDVQVFNRAYASAMKVPSCSTLSPSEQARVGLAFACGLDAVARMAPAQLAQASEPARVEVGDDVVEAFGRERLRAVKMSGEAKASEARLRWEGAAIAYESAVAIVRDIGVVPRAELDHWVKYAADIAQELSDAAAQRDQLSSDIAVALRRLAVATSDLAAVTKRAETAEREAQCQREIVAMMERNVHELRDDIDRRKSELMDVLAKYRDGEGNEWKARAETAERDVESLHARDAILAARADTAERERDEWQARAKAAELDVESLRAREAVHVTLAETAERAHANANDDAARCIRERRAAERERDELAQRLASAHSDYEGRTEQLAAADARAESAERERDEARALLAGRVTREMANRVYALYFEARNNEMPAPAMHRALTFALGAPAAEPAPVTREEAHWEPTAIVELRDRIDAMPTREQFEALCDAVRALAASHHDADARYDATTALNSAKGGV